MANQPRRTAIVAVHGVGNPGQGTTSKNIADLLLSLNKRQGRTAEYSAFAEECICLPVRPMARMEGIDESVPSSPFDDRGPYIRARHHKKNLRPEISGDVGFMYDMIHKLSDEGPAANYKTARLSTTRSDVNGDSVQIDLYELYWADLVRLGKGALQVVGEFYQVLLHLPSLGQRELDMARANSPNWAWWLFDSIQDFAVRLLCLPLPILNLMILAITLVGLPMWIPAGAKGYTAAGVLVVGGSAAMGWTFFNRLKVLKWWQWQLLGMLCASGFAVLANVLGCFRSDAQFGACNLLGIEWVIVASIGLGWVVHFYNKRRPGAREVALYGGVPVAVFAMILIGWMGNRVGQVFEAAFNIAQLLWYGLMACWGALFISTLAAVGCGFVAMFKGGEAEGRAGRVAWTARLTLAISTALFFVTTILFWAAITAVGKGLLPSDIKYVPMEIGPEWFRKLLPWIAGTDWSGASTHVYSLGNAARYFVAASGTLAFSAVVGLLSLAVVLACWALLPPVMGDIFPPRMPAKHSVGFGTWLNHGYRQLRAAGELVFIATLVIGPLTYFRAQIVHKHFPHVDFEGAANLLWKTGTWVGAAVATLVVTGRLNSIASTVGPIMTAILDVDAYMRVHPRSENPRARIFTRYVALLRHLCSVPQPYDQIIIVSHSQGTVITADLLRFLGEFGDPTLRPIGMAEGSKPALIPIHLMTMGCPLRQLYGKRFPNLYDWVVGEADGDSMRPDPMSIGVWRWMNMYRTGDYVGRWLWRKQIADQLKPDVMDIVDKEQDPWSATWGPARTDGVLAGPGKSIQEICLGGGAHVRYFDINAPAVAYKIDELV